MNNENNDGITFINDDGTRNKELNTNVEMNNNLNTNVDEVSVNAPKPVVDIQSTAVKGENDKMVSQGFEKLNNDNFYEKDRKIWPIVLVIILALIVGFGCYYYFVLTKPINIVKRTLNNVYSVLEKTSEEYDVADAKSLSGNANIIFTSNDTDLKELSGLNVNLGFGSEIENINNNYIDVNATLQKQKLIDLKASLIDNKIYLDLKDSFDKIIYSELEEELEFSFNDLFDDEIIKESSSDVLYLIKVIKDSIINNMSEEKLNKKMLMKDVDSKKVPAIEIKYNLDYQEYKKLYKGILDTLATDSKSVSILSKYTSESEVNVKNNLINLKENVSELDFEEMNYTLTIDAFTNKLLEFVASNDETVFTITDKGDEDNLEIILSDVGSVTVTIDEKEKKAFMDVKIMDEVRFSFTFKVDKDTKEEMNATLSFVLYDEEDINKEMATITCKLESQLNKQIVPVNKTSAVNVESLSEADQEKLMSVLSPIMGMFPSEYEVE